MGDEYISRSDAMKAITEEYNRRRDGDGLKLAWIEKALNSVKGWIPVSERLPEHDGLYLATNDKWGEREVFAEIFHEGKFIGNGNITAWMPLPDPYKGE